MQANQTGERKTAKPSRAEQLTAAFRQAAKRAIADHTAADRSVFGKVDARLTGVVGKKNK